MDLVRRLQDLPRRWSIVGVAVGLLVVGAALAAAGATRSNAPDDDSAAVEHKAAAVAERATTTTTVVAPAPREPAPVDAGVAAGPDGSVGGGGDGPGNGGAGGTCVTVSDSGSGCLPSSIPPPDGSGYGGIPDYPGRYQVDPSTGEVVDTGIASQPGPVVDIPVVPTTAPSPPVITPTPSPTTVPPTTPTTAAGLGIAPGAPVG